MTRPDSIAALAAISRDFGPRAAEQKSGLLASISAGAPYPPRQLLLLHDTLCFMRAYPDDSTLWRQVVALTRALRLMVAGLRDSDRRRLADTGVPGTINHHAFSFATLQQLSRRYPDCLEIDWDALEDDMAIHQALVLLVTNGECQGLDDIRFTMSEWAARARSDPAMTDLELVLRLFEGSTLGAQEQAYVFESCGLSIGYRLLYEGLGRCEVALPRQRRHYQKERIAQPRVPLQPEIERPLTDLGLADRATGETLVALALAALCSRNLEISSLIYANPAAVTAVECGRGLQVVLIGVVPEYRDGLEVSYFFMILKNGVPMGYGPASVCLGCCEMGINLFPEFRGGEIRLVYAQFMRVLHHVLGVRYFYLTSYGMGEGNPEAIRTGAFWFYRKLGFTATDPGVEALARVEEAKLQRHPGYRTSPHMLRRLSHTDACFDISSGACRRLDLGALGLRQSRLIAGEFGGDRRLAEARCTAQIAHLLDLGDVAAGTPARQHALRILAPVLCMIPDLARWPAADKRRLARILAQKGGRSEGPTDRLINGHRRLLAALRELASPADPGLE